MQQEHAKGQRRGAPQAAFTLVELLIALFVTSFVALLVMTVFTAQAESYRQQEDVARAQQNIRLAMEIVTRDVGMAGFGLSAEGQAWGASSSYGAAEDQPLAALYVRQNWSGDGTDAVQIAYMDPDNESWVIAFPGVPPACDTAVVQADEDDYEIVPRFDAEDRLICYDPGFRAGARAFIWDVTGTGDPGTGQIPVTANSQADFTARCNDGTGQGLSREMSCGALVGVAYYIDSDDSDGMGPGSPAQPVLMLSFESTWPDADDIPIALGIEDMQFELCRVGNDCRSTGYETDFDALDTRSTDFSTLQILGVRMMSRSLRTDVNRTAVSRRVDLSPSDPYNTEAADPDGYHRRVASTDVLLRNAQTAWQTSQVY